jgi:hypothetical protein
LSQRGARGLLCEHRYPFEGHDIAAGSKFLGVQSVMGFDNETWRMAVNVRICI